LLDVENAGEQLLRGFLCIERDCTIQKPGLRGKLHRLGFVERRDRHDLAESPQSVDGNIQVSSPITNIGAKRKIDKFVHSDEFTDKCWGSGIQIKTCGAQIVPARLKISAEGKAAMLSIHAKIDRTQRLLRMLEEDAPLLAVRVAQLTPERQQSAKDYAAQLTAHARAELEKLLAEGYFWDANDPTPQAAD
jgi:hypothetical protein